MNSSQVWGAGGRNGLRAAGDTQEVCLEKMELENPGLTLLVGNGRGSSVLVQCQAQSMESRAGSCGDTSGQVTPPWWLGGCQVRDTLAWGRSCLTPGRFPAFLFPRTLRALPQESWGTDGNPGAGMALPWNRCQTLGKGGSCSCSRSPWSHPWHRICIPAVLVAREGSRELSSIPAGGSRASLPPQEHREGFGTAWPPPRCLFWHNPDPPASKQPGNRVSHLRGQT